MLKGKIGNIYFDRILEGEDLAKVLVEKTEEFNVKSGVFILIGSLKQATLGYYKDGKYDSVQMAGPLEIASCMGNIAVDEKGNTIVHSHIVLTDEKGRAFGGHLMNGSIVGATAELVVLEAVGIGLKRILDKNTNLKLLKSA